jgi:ribonuclease Z
MTSMTSNASNASMIDNSPFRTLVHKGLTVEGHSRAVVQSCWRIPELKF